MMIFSLKVTIKMKNITVFFLFSFYLITNVALADGIERQAIERQKDILSAEFSDKRIKRCLTDGIDPVQCSRTLINFCATHPAVQSEEVFGHCIGMQHEFWDAHLNKVYRKLMVLLTQEDDIRDTREGQSVMSLKAALRKAQRAWIVYRDAKCEYMRFHMGPTLGGAIRYTECVCQRKHSTHYGIEKRAFIAL